MPIGINFGTMFVRLLMNRFTFGVLIIYLEDKIMKAKGLFLLAVSAMLAMNVSARNVQRGKCKNKRIRQEQRFVQLRHAAPVKREIRFVDARSTAPGKEAIVVKVIQSEPRMRHRPPMHKRARHHRLVRR